MRLYTLTAAVCLLLALSCDKKENFIDFPQDIGGEGIRGRLFVEEEASGQIVPLPDRFVMLDYPSEDESPTALPDSNALFIVKTDTEGYFEFTYLKGAEQEYQVHFRERLSDGIIYQSDATVMSGNDSLALVAKVATTGQTGVRILTQEEDTRKILTGVKSCFYTTAAAAAAGKDSCSGAAFVLTSNLQGQSSRFGIAGEEYHVVSQYNAGGGRWKSLDTIIVFDELVTDTVISLIPPKIDSSNRITLLTVDANGDPLPRTSVCLFTSQLLYETRDICEGQNYSYTTNDIGIITVAAPPNGRYFVLGRFEVNDSTNWLSKNMEEVLILPDAKGDTVRLELLSVD